MGNMSKKGKKQLAGIIRQVLRSKELTLKEAASKLDIPDNTFRSDLRRNTFGKYYISNLLTILDLHLSLPELQKKYDFNLAESYGVNRKIGHLRESNSKISLEEALDYIEGRVKKFWRTQKDIPHNIGILLKSMRADDLMVFSSLNIPAREFTAIGWLQLRTSVIQAIKNRAYLVYLHPDNEVIKRMKKWRYYEVRNEQVFQYDMDKFKKNINQELEQKEFDLVKEHVIGISCGDGPFWLPNTAFVLFRTVTIDGMIRSQLITRLPTGTSTSENEMMLPYSPDFTNLFIEFLTNALEKQRKSKEIKTVLNLLRGRPFKFENDIIDEINKERI